MMERGMAYLSVLVLFLALVMAGSMRKGFQPAKFILSLLALYFLPGLAVAFWNGLLMFFSDKSIWIPVVSGIAAGFFLFKIIFIRLGGFSTFEHELSHALVALLFFRRIKKFIVTRQSGGYVEFTEGFGGKTANHFITLAPYFLPTFTLISVLIRPFLPVSWFPWYDVWTGITFAFQTMNNIDELKRNWTRKPFKAAGHGKLSKSDIAIEGYIFSFLLIVVLKLLFLAMLVFILSGSYPALPMLFKTIWNNSLFFFTPVMAEIYQFIRDLI